MSSSISKQGIKFFFIVGILLLISAGILSFISNNDRIEHQDNVRSAYIRSEMLKSIQYQITDAEASRRGYFISNDKQYLSAYSDAKESIDGLFNSYKTNKDNRSEFDYNLDTLKGLVSQRFELFDESIAVQESKGNNMKFHAGVMEKGKMVQSNVRSFINRMRKNEDNIINTQNTALEKSYKFASYTTLISLGLGALIFIVIYIILSKKASKVFEAESRELSMQELEQIIKERTSEISQINQKLNSKLSELQRKDEILKASEQYYKMLFDQSHDGIWILSLDDKTILDANESICKMYGYTKNEFIGKKLSELSKNPAQDQSYIDEIVNKGFVENVQTVRYKKDKTEMLLEVNSKLINYKGKAAILSHARDITHKIMTIENIP